MTLAEKLKIERDRQNLFDRYHFITRTGVVTNWDRDNLICEYISRFDRTLVSKDVYEEFQFICSELGCENPLDV